jgi:ABC-2 type transport system permease protein
MSQADLRVYDSDAVRLQSAFELKELWRYRFLIGNLIARDLKVRYKRSALGFIWVMLNPLLMMGVMTIVFSSIFRFAIPHYSAYLLGGILVWNLFSQGSVATMSSLQSNGRILQKMYVPPSAFVASAVGSALVNLAFALIPFFGLAILVGVTPSPTWAFVVVPIVETTLFTFGVGLITAALYVFFHDIYEIYSVFLTALMYLTPIFYPVSKLPIWVQNVEKFNPMFQFINTFRNPVLIPGYVPPLHILLPGAIMSLLAFAIGWLVFTQLEGRFANYF